MKVIRKMHSFAQSKLHPKIENPTIMKKALTTSLYLFCEERDRLFCLSDEEWADDPTVGERHEHMLWMIEWTVDQLHHCK